MKVNRKKYLIAFYFAFLNQFTNSCKTSSGILFDSMHVHVVSNRVYVETREVAHTQRKRTGQKATLFKSSEKFVFKEKSWIDWLKEYAFLPKPWSRFSTYSPGLRWENLTSCQMRKMSRGRSTLERDDFELNRIDAVATI